MTKHLLIAFLLLFSMGTKAQNSNTGQKYVHLITEDGIPHRDYEGNIIVSSFEKIAQLLNNDVDGYYDILAKDKNEYLAKFQKERKYLLEDEFQREIPYNSCYRGDGSHDIWWLKYDTNKHCFTFDMHYYYSERYKLSCEKGPFHLLICLKGINYCLTYPKSLITVKDNRYSDGSGTEQEQTVYTCRVSEEDAKLVPDDVVFPLLWQFKIEKVNVAKRRLYGKSTKLQITYNGSVIVDLSKTFSERGNTYNRVSSQNHTVSPAKWHVCSGCNGKGWGTGINDSRRRTCPTCGGKGKVYY